MNIKFNGLLFNLLQLSKHLMNLKRKMLFLGPALLWINLVVLWAMQFYLILEGVAYTSLILH